MLNSESLLWRYAADVRSLLPGTSAGVMQLMYPQLGTGVEQHSDFFNEPFERINRSVPQIWATIFMSDGDARGKRIRDMHRGINGIDSGGHRYHALEPETFWWAHATFTWEIFRSVEFFHPETLTPAQREQLYADTVEWYGRYGVSMRSVPENYTAFQAKFRHICADVLEVTPTAARALEIAAHPRAINMLPGVPELLGRAAGLVMAPPARLLMYGCFPEVVRERCGITWTAADSVQFAGLAITIAQGGRVVPRPVNHWGMRSALRFVGAHTRAQRYQPAA